MGFHAPQQTVYSITSSAATRRVRNSAGSHGPLVKRPASDFRAPATWCYPSNVCLGVMASFSHAMTWEVVHVAA